MPASYLTLERGTPVVDRFGHAVGRVKRVLIAGGLCFDGIVVDTKAGLGFVDAPEVRRIRRAEVELAVTCSDVVHPGPKGRRVRATPTACAATASTRPTLTAPPPSQLKIAFVEDASASTSSSGASSAPTRHIGSDLDAVLDDLL